MTQKQIYKVKDIEVWEQRTYIFHNSVDYSTDELSYLIRKGDDEFTTWDKPTLNYEALRKMILEYREDKNREMADEAENEDRREDEESFWEIDTEGY